MGELEKSLCDHTVGGASMGGGCRHRWPTPRPSAAIPMASQLTPPGFASAGRMSKSTMLLMSESVKNVELPRDPNARRRMPRAMGMSSPLRSRSKGASMLDLLPPINDQVCHARAQHSTHTHNGIHTHMPWRRHTVG